MELIFVKDYWTLGERFRLALEFGTNCVQSGREREEKTWEKAKAASWGQGTVSAFCSEGMQDLKQMKAPR